MYKQTCFRGHVVSSICSFHVLLPVFLLLLECLFLLWADMACVVDNIYKHFMAGIHVS